MESTHSLRVDKSEAFRHGAGASGLPHVGSVTLSTLLNLSVPQFPHMRNGDNNKALYLTELRYGLSEITPGWCFCYQYCYTLKIISVVTWRFKSDLNYVAAIIKI